MAATVALRPDRLLFSSSADVDDDSADINCAIVASGNALTLQGAGGDGNGALVRLTGLANPTSATDALTAGYTSWKAPVRIATSNPIASAFDFDGGVFTASAQGMCTVLGTVLELNDRVLVAAEATAAWNGIYVVTDAGGIEEVAVLTRAHDFDGNATVAGAAVSVRAGSNAGKIYIVSNTVEPTINTDGIDFAWFTSSTDSGGGGPVVLENNSVNLTKIVHGSESGQLLAFDVAVGDPDDPENFAPIFLHMGTQGRPLVAGGPGGLPGYTELTTNGLADDAVTGPKLAEAVYRPNLIIGNATREEYIHFNAADTGSVGIHVNGSVKLSATIGGGSFVGTWAGSSDEKWKNLLGPVTADPLADLDAVEPQSWTWKDGFHLQAGGFGAGVVAQQFQIVCPSAVSYSDEQDGLVVDYNAVHSFSLSCLKALKVKYQACAAENAALEARTALLEELLMGVRAHLASLDLQNAAILERRQSLEAGTHTRT